jgi:hypothetical protein
MSILKSLFKISNRDSNLQIYWMYFRLEKPKKCMTYNLVLLKIYWWELWWKIKVLKEKIFILEQVIKIIWWKRNSSIPWKENILIIKMEIKSPLENSLIFKVFKKKKNTFLKRSLKKKFKLKKTKKMAIMCLKKIPFHYWPMTSRRMMIINLFN